MVGKGNTSKKTDSNRSDDGSSSDAHIQASYTLALAILNSFVLYVTIVVTMLSVNLYRLLYE